MKQEALDALQSDVLAAPNPHPDAMDEDDSEWTVPKVSSMDDFELAKASKDKGRPTGNYETLVGTVQLKSVVVNWEPVFVQFKDPNGEWVCIAFDITHVSSCTVNSCHESPIPRGPGCSPSIGGLLPVKVSIPPIYAEDEEDPSTQKGKRKAVE